MNSLKLSELDFLMVCAADLELNTYGTIRMVKEISAYQPGDVASHAASTCRGIQRFEENRYVVEDYHFELLTPDFEEDEYAPWDAIAQYQEELSVIFESLDFEGVGFNPNPPQFIETQSMTWFYPAESLDHHTCDPEFVEQALSSLGQLNTSSAFLDAQRVAAVSTFAKHQCPHVWSGEPEYWECTTCGAMSFLEELPESSS